MSTHTICFGREIRNLLVLIVSRTLDLSCRYFCLSCLLNDAIFFSCGMSCAFDFGKAYLGKRHFLLTEGSYLGKRHFLLTEGSYLRAMTLYNSVNRSTYGCIRLWATLA